MEVLIGLIMELIGFVLILKGCGRIEDGGGGMMIFGLILIASAAIPLVLSSNKQRKETNQKIDTYKSKTDIPSNARTIKYIEGMESINYFIKESQYYIWREANNIKLALNPINVINLATEVGQGKVMMFPIDKIQYYSIVGDAYTETNVKGGGSSLTGAVVGGVIAGGAGAVIGSRKEIKTETNRVDNRKTIITYSDNGTTRNIFFAPDAYETLLQLIPEKDINFINSNINSSASTQNKDDINNDVYDKIRQLAKLKDDGILTEEEFNSKKKVLLEKIS
ncbi:SHOCT domain-containing protein [Clostridium omnivorum]|uniref:SHOCT domain-containing protein n=1 Tax=Clostridium omnivorum TaxID=1604902 RepID=A0ABQ5NAD1_9CLOT|nr:SHOCT domain-containing protein [Clostridium sp. E14]GLC32178.1 hypothetical protein bsdE14_35880 [Clostridium sp. E14]